MLERVLKRFEREVKALARLDHLHIVKIYDYGEQDEVADWYDKDYYSRSPRQNPPGPSSGEYRVLRGGLWNLSDNDLRAALRDRGVPDDRGSINGFRCVRWL